MAGVLSALCLLALLRNIFAGFIDELIALNVSGLPEHCIHVLAGKIHDFQNCGCVALDQHIMGRFERQLQRSWTDDDRMWSDRFDCLKQRQSLQRRCQARGYHHMPLIDSCTRSPGTWWAARNVNVTDAIFSQFRKTCNSDTKYLLWTRNFQDYYAGHERSDKAFECAVSEATALGRTLIYDDYDAVPGSEMDGVRGFTHGLEIPKRAWHNRETLWDIPGMAWTEFVVECGVEGVIEAKDRVTLPYNAHFDEMRRHNDARLLIRDFTMVSHAGVRFSGADLCESPSPAYSYGVPSLPEAKKTTLLTGRLTSKANVVLKLLREHAVENGVGELPTDVVCVDARRGNWLWVPRMVTLDKDTRPENILRVLHEAELPPRSVVYIATNEPEASVFYAEIAEEYDVVTFDMIREVENIGYKLLAATIGLVERDITQRCPALIPTFRDEDSRGPFFTNVSLSQHCRNARSARCTGWRPEPALAP